MFIDSKTVEYLTLIVMKGDAVPITHMCGECDTVFRHSASAARDHGVVKTSDDWTIVIGCEGWHQLDHTVGMTAVAHELAMPDCSDPDCEIHHAAPHSAFEVEVTTAEGKKVYHPFVTESDARHYFAECQAQGFDSRLIIA